MVTAKAGKPVLCGPCGSFSVPCLPKLQKIRVSHTGLMVMLKVLMGMYSWRSKLGAFLPSVRRENIICLPGVFSSAICLFLLNVRIIKEREMKKKLCQAA